MAGRGPPAHGGAGVIRVLIVDDEALVRSGFRLILGSEPDIEVVGDAADGEAAIRLAGELEPDVILMDIRMPRLDGVEATRRLSASEYKVLILTTFDLDEYLFAAVKAGASGFLLKDVPPDELIDAIRAVSRGDALVQPRMTRRLLDEFARSGATGVAGPPPPGWSDLTEREVEVFQAMARGLSNAEIGAELFISETTVKSHVAHVLMKLGLRDRVQAVVLAYESGVVTPGTP